MSDLPEDGQGFWETLVTIKRAQEAFMMPAWTYAEYPPPEATTVVDKGLIARSLKVRPLPDGVVQMIPLSNEERREWLDEREALRTPQQQFIQFGRLTVQKMLDRNGLGYIDFNEWDHEDIENYAEIVAQCAYDLVQHTIDALWPYINDTAVDPSARDIPDLDAWPEEAK